MADDKSSEISAHRKQMKDKFIEYGADVFEKYGLLELLLYFSVSGKDTKIMAHNLIDKFGSLSGVFDAPFDILLESGVTENTAFILKFLPEFFGVYGNDKLKDNNKVLDSGIIQQRLINLYLGKTVEMAYLILMNDKLKELYSGIVSRGTTVSTDLNVPKICELAVHYSAKYVIVAHNHPRGTTIPSESDVLATINLYQALDSLHITLTDHFIISGDDCVSFYDIGIMFKTKEEYFNSEFYKQRFFT